MGARCCRSRTASFFLIEKKSHLYFLKIAIPCVECSVVAGNCSLQKATKSKGFSFSRFSSIAFIVPIQSLFKSVNANVSLVLCLDTCLWVIFYFWFHWHIDINSHMLYEKYVTSSYSAFSIKCKMFIYKLVYCLKRQHNSVI